MNSGTAKPMLVAGVMSGTSADGADVALCRVSPAKQRGGTPRVKVLGHRAFPYPARLRKAVLASMDAKHTTTAELARLSWKLGAFYADCVEATAQDLALKPQLIACHGQTIYHQGLAAPYLGTPVRCTWQIGEASLIAERMRAPVVSDFRPADMAAGGQAAPLVPMLDFCLFRHATKNRLLLNLGGIANITAIPAAAKLEDVLAFDTGPANMVIDACMQQLFDKRYDKNGALAARGRVLQDVLVKLFAQPYFAAPPPKSCGREEFGETFTTRFLALCKRARAANEDVIATATAFTSTTILEAYRDFCWPHLGQRAPLARASEIFVAGGGARNATLMRMLGEGFRALSVKVATTEAAGLAVEAKEAAAFALMGWLTWHGLPGNVPSATGASRAVVLGKVTQI
ncbi:MAG TPA: anhydro-N-acetylmuramic acid kinase [Acidobacteriaceae bacterium]|jgi:anhydro-N-acetylmuramic acid kinase